jgi:anti-sigma B factor antagonist
MGLDMKVRMSNGVAILDLDGKLLCGPETGALRETLSEVFGQGHTRILLNLEKVLHADSGGLGDLVAAYTAITRRGGAIKLLRPQEKILAMLRLTHIDSLVEICDDERAAVAGFGPAAKPRGMDARSDFFSG